MKTQCTSCSMPYDSYAGDFLKCFSCNQKESKKMIAHINRPKIVQNNRTKHLTKEVKEKICEYIIETHGVLYRSYRDSVPFICEKFNVQIDFGGVRALVNSEYFQKLAFDE